jgi:hypothetical protein
LAQFEMTWSIPSIAPSPCSISKNAYERHMKSASDN